MDNEMMEARIRRLAEHTAPVSSPVSSKPAKPGKEM